MRKRLIEFSINNPAKGRDVAGRRKIQEFAEEHGIDCSRREAESIAKEAREEKNEEDRTLYEIIRENYDFENPNPDEVLQAYLKFKDKERSLEEAYSVVNVKVPADSPILLTSVADVHFGNKWTDDRQFLEDMEEIESRDYVKAIFAGDFVEGGILPQMMDLIQEQSLGPKAQRKLMWPMLERIVPNCLCFITGQHDNWTEQEADFDWIEWFADSHDVHYMGWGGCIYLTVGCQQWKILARHKYKYNSSYNPGHSVRQLMRMGPWGFGDIGIVADKHEYTYECSELGGRPTAIMRPGSYKPTDHYVQEHGYNPARPYMPGIILWPDRRQFLGNRDFRMLLPVIDAMVDGRIDWEDFPEQNEPEGRRK